MCSRWASIEIVSVGARPGQPRGAQNGPPTAISAVTALTWFQFASPPWASSTLSRSSLLICISSTIGGRGYRRGNGSLDEIGDLVGLIPLGPVGSAIDQVHFRVR